MRRSPLLLVLLGLLIAASAFASTISPPSNLGELARISGAVVLAEAQDSRSELHGEAPYTVTDFRVLQRVKGDVPARLEVQEAGGVYGTVGLTVTGAPRFEKGGRYLLFLAGAPGGRWQSAMLSYGLLREDEATGTLRALPEAAELNVLQRPGVEPVGVYRTQELLQRLEAAANGVRVWQREAVAAAPLASDSSSSATAGDPFGGTSANLTNVPASCQYVQAPDGLPSRWFGFETGGFIGVWHTTPGQVGISDGGVSAVQLGATTWANDPDNVIGLTYAGSKARTASCASGDARVGNNEVVFNDPCGQIPDLTACEGTLPAGWTSPNCCGQVAIFGTFVNMSPNAPAPHSGDNWRPITGMSVIVNNGSQCLGETDFKEMGTHFLGHGVGFGHHADPNATMFAQLGAHAPRGAALNAIDRRCANYAYNTFLDVPFSRWSWQFVEAFQNARLDPTGCGGGNFCPEVNVNRGQLAVFIVRGSRGPDFVPPPATGTLFADVPASHPQAAYIEQLYNDGLTGGCNTNPLRFCPEGSVSRAEMATFLLRISHGPSYTPPPATGTTFQDAPANYWATPYIEQLFRDGGTAGCSSSPPLYCPEQLVVKEQVATFLDRAFSLPIPTP
ncbi:MAG TPA: S-layer homology domain-containing protein [Thermoanaerobaculia bacterium]|nr:S-layer homology domain-containing protein [Thermoanaerobaculia bacterium]